MFKINAIKKRRQERVREEILKHGLILFGFNLALILVFVFGFIALSLGAQMITDSILISAFAPMLFLLIFAGASAILWYRFGQLLGAHFKKRKIINTALVVLISALPVLALILLLSAVIGFAGGFTNEVLALTFLSFFLMSVLASVFELLLVSLGVITTVR